MSSLDEYSIKQSVILLAPRISSKLHWLFSLANLGVVGCRLPLTSYWVSLRGLNELDHIFALRDWGSFFLRSGADPIAGFLDLLPSQRRNFY